MSMLFFEKRLNALPAQLSADTAYFIKTVDGKLDIYVSDKDGLYALRGNSGGGSGGSNFTLRTTDKLPVANNKILLPSSPEGAIVHNVMIVYDEIGLMWEYDGVTVVHETDGSYAVLNESESVSGYGVVTYLERI